MQSMIEPTTQAPSLAVQRASLRQALDRMHSLRLVATQRPSRELQRPSDLHPGSRLQLTMQTPSAAMQR